MMTTTTAVPRANAVRIAVLVWVIAALSYVFLIPVGNNLLLYPLLLSFAVLTAVNIWKRRIVPDRSFIWPAAFWAAFLAVGVIGGIVQHAESWARTLVFFLVWPAVYAVIIAGFDRRVVKAIFWVGAAVTVIIGVLFFLEGLAAAGKMPPLPTFITAPLSMRYVTDPTGMIAMSSTTIPPVIWWGGMWIASLFVDGKDRYLPPIWVRAVAATLAIAGAFISWRRAVVVVVIVAVVLALGTVLVLKFRNRAGESPRITWRGIGSVAAVFVVALGITLTVQPSLGTMFSHLVGSSTAAVGPVAPVAPASHTPAASAAAIPRPTAAPLTQKDITAAKSKPMTASSEDALSDKIRSNESRSLTNAKTPSQVLVGRGFGATFDRGGIKRAIRPWQTELQYHAIYYWTGIVGLLLLVATVLSGVYVIRKAFKVGDDLTGVLYVASVGSVTVILANGTNPYLQAPGHMWALFFPLMIASAIFAGLGRDARRGESSAESVDGGLVGGEVGLGVGGGRSVR